MALDPTMQAALAGPVIHPFVAVEIDHPQRMIRLLDGLGSLIVGGNMYLGLDPDVGSLASASIDSEGVGDEAPSATVALNPISAEVGVGLCVPQAQGAGVRILWGAYNPANGQIVGSPYVGFVGQIDVPTLNVGDDLSGAVSFACVCDFEVFFEANQGQRLSHAFHTSIFPGELGLQYVVDVKLNMPWGVAGARPDLTRAS